MDRGHPDETKSGDPSDQELSPLVLATRLTPHWESHGQFVAGRDTLESALAAQDGPPAEQAEAYGALATLATVQGDLAAARRAHQEAISLHAAIGNEGAVASATSALAVVLLRSGDHEAAEDAGLLALAASEQLEDDRGRAFALSCLGLIAAARHSPDEAFEHLLHSSELFRAQGLRHESASVLANLGNLAQDVGDDQRSSRFYDGALQLFDSIEDRRGAALCLNNLAILANAHGDVDHAIELARRALDRFTVVADLRGEAAMLNNLAGFWEAHGAFTEARMLYEQAIARFEKLQDVAGRTTAQQNLDGLCPVSTELSDREAQVAELVAAGMSNRLIAEELFVSERTVHSHLSHIFTKLDLTSRTQLVKWWATVGQRGGTEVRE
ncbi:MAG: tetratricopeptide repeat protein [Acidimicrobiales bacterium]|nr:tetratricopeptide repeat protein [Acidimicrobiales bacterium]